jgi:hypothetical protein
MKSHTFYNRDYFMRIFRRNKVDIATVSSLLLMLSVINLYSLEMFGAIDKILVFIFASTTIFAIFFIGPPIEDFLNRE